MFNQENIIIGLSGSKKLVDLIAKNLGTKQAQTTISHFADGETLVRVDESIRGKHVFLVQSTSKPVNENVMELLIAIDSIKRASAKKITVICPYYGYARQDRKSIGREPITAKLVANLIEKVGVDNICIIEPHSNQIQGFFDIPVDIVSMLKLIMDEIKKDNNLKNTIIVSPDYGCVKKVKKLSLDYNIPMVILNKYRPKPNVAEITNILGEDVKNKNCLIIDDMIDTGGTIIAACKALKEKGCNNIIVGATHGILSNDAENKLNLACKNKLINHLYISNTINTIYDKKINKLKIVDISKQLAKIIKVYTNPINGSISKICYSKK